MLSTAESVDNFEQRLSSAVEEIGRVLYGKDESIKLALCCLLARGHLLIDRLARVGLNDSCECCWARYRA